MSLEHLVIPNGKEFIKDDQDPTERLKREIEEAPTGQRQDTFSIYKDSNCNELKHIKYVSIHKFIVTFKKKKKTKTKIQLSSLKDARRTN